MVLLTLYLNSSFWTVSHYLELSFSRSVNKRILDEERTEMLMVELSQSALKSYTAALPAFIFNFSLLDSFRR